MHGSFLFNPNSYSIYSVTFNEVHLVYTEHNSTYIYKCANKIKEETYMKRNKKVLFSVVLVLIVVLSFSCSNDNSLGPEKIIDEFLNEKSELYDKKDEIIIKSGEEYLNEVNEILKEVKVLLTEKEYERLLANRYLMDTNLVNEIYDKAEIKNIEYEKVSEDTAEAVYLIKYTENLYFKDELKEEINHSNKFYLEKIDDKWLISHID